MIYYSGYTRLKRHSSALAILFAFAICAAVAGLVFLVMQPKMAANLKDKPIPLICFVAMALFTVWGFVVYFTKRFRVTIAQQDDGSLFLEVKDPSLPAPLVVHDPITLSKQWTLVDLGRRNKIKMLYLTVLDPAGNALVTFTGGLGNFYDAPDGFVPIHGVHEAMMAQQVYDTGKIQDIAYAFWCHEDFLSRRKG